MTAKNRYPDPILFQLPARSLTDLLTTLAANLDRRQPHNSPALHPAQTEVVSEDRCILESVSCELGAYTPGGWVRLFEVRFSLRAQPFQQHSPRVTRSRALPMTMSGTARSPWTPSQVTSETLPGSSPVCCGSASCEPGLTGDKKLRWLGPPLPVRVLLLSPCFCLLLILLSLRGAGAFFFSLQFERAD